MYNRQFKNCRAFGHQWRPTTVEKHRDDWGQVAEYIQNVKCVCCHTEKAIRINPRGEIAGRRYRYTDGYQLKGRLAADLKAEMRREIVDG